MKFDWRKFTKADYVKLLKENDYIGAVYIGDICIELVVDKYYAYHENEIWYAREMLEMNFYVAHEDTGYGYKNCILPYDYADGIDIEIPYELSYEEFKGKAEKMFTDYIESYKGNYSLVEHANRPLEIW